MDEARTGLLARGVTFVGFDGSKDDYPNPGRERTPKARMAMLDGAVALAERHAEVARDGQDDDERSAAADWCRRWCGDATAMLDALEVEGLEGLSSRRDRLTALRDAMGAILGKGEE